MNTSNVGSTEVECDRFTLIYDMLKGIARRERRRMPDRHLDTTSLVHEAWLKLERSNGEFVDERHYLSTAALAMRQIATDFARARLARRGPASVLITTPMATELLSEEAASSRRAAGELNEIDILAIDEALIRLAEIDPALVEIVQLRFFAGFTLDELASHQDICVRTASRYWRRAKALLRVLLKEGPS